MDVLVIPIGVSLAWLQHKLAPDARFDIFMSRALLNVQPKEVTMAKGNDTKKAVKKAPAKTLKEKRKAKNSKPVD